MERAVIRENIHTEEMQDIITTIPSVLLRFGNSIFLGILVLLFLLAGVIRYPDIVNATLKIQSPNSPKPIVAKFSGKVVRILVNDHQTVKEGQALAFMESTADHQKIISLLTNLKALESGLAQNRSLDFGLISTSSLTDLGELQGSFQIFFQEYLNFKSSIQNGYLIRKRSFLEDDLGFLNKQRQQLKLQRALQEKDMALSNDDYEMHKKLAQQKVETKAEFRQQESRYLANKTPSLQTDAAILTAGNTYQAKKKEILELDNSIQEERSRFQQALNSIISVAEDWKNKYILWASQTGTVSFAGIVQPNQVVSIGQEVFYVDAGSHLFFGEMAIKQENMGKVKEGQEVLIKLKSYPFEQFGIIYGKLQYLSDVPFKDSIYMSRVEFRYQNVSDIKKPIHLKQGMLADAEIITQNATLLQRLTWNFLKILRN
jgi:multidrug resistance efflux pump